MAIAFVNDTSHIDINGGALGNNISISGLQTGDLIMCVLTIYDQTGGTITPPSGWNLYRRDEYSPNNQWTHAIYWRFSDGTESWNFTVPAQYTEQYAIAYRGTDTTTPLVDTGTANSGTGSPATGTSVNVSTDGSVLFFSEAAYSNALSGAPAGMTLRETYDTVNNFYDQSVNAGATGNRTATISGAGADGWSVTMGVIAPPGGAVVVAAPPRQPALFFGTGF